MSELKLLDDLQNFAKYKVDLAKSLARVGKIPAPVLFVKKFQFTTKALPMVLVGPVDAKLKTALVAQKIPMKLGKCVRREDGKIVLDALNAIEVNAAFEAAAVKDQIDPNADFEKVGMGAVANMLEKHLNDTGRATGDEGKRDQAAGKILAGMEKATNERNKVIDPSKPESHHVSAHGPGTDQVTRLVAGRRPDEVTDENLKGKTPTKTVKLTGNTHGIADQEVPVYEKAGQNTSNRSGAFSTNTAMLHALEEAYSQATQLDSYLGSIMKDAFDKNNEEVLKKSEVKEALMQLQTARKGAQTVALQLKKPGMRSEQLVQLKSMLVTLEKKAKELTTSFQETFKNHGGDKLQRPDEMNVGSSRLVRGIDPGTGKGFLPEGLGTGLVAEGIDKQKKGGKIATGGKTEEEVMQERFQNIKTVKGQNTARVVMDPAFVKDDNGKLRRAGWDVQTAFPQEGGSQDSLSDPKVVKEFVATNKAIKTTELELVEVNKEHVTLNMALKKAQKSVESQSNSIKIKEKNLLPQFQEQFDKATEGQKKTDAGTKLENLKKEIEHLKSLLPPLQLKEIEAKEAFDKIELKKVELDLKLKQLKVAVEGVED